MLRFTEVTDSEEPFVFDYPGDSMADADSFSKDDFTKLGRFVRKLFDDKSIGLRFRIDIIPNE